LNVLFISLEKNLLLPKSGDSINRHRRYASQLGHLDIIVLTKKRDGITHEVRKGNLTIVPTNSGSRWWYTTDALRIAAKLFSQKKVDVVSAQDPFICAAIALLLKAKWRVPVNIQVHNDYFSSLAWRTESFENRAFFHLGKWLLRKADSIRTVTRSIEQSVRTFVPPGIPIHTVIVPPSTNFLKKASPKKDIHIISTGNLTEQKDFPTLIEALAKLKGNIPNLNVQIIGAGPRLEILKRQTERLDLTANIRFAGECAQKGVIDALARSKVYVSSSKYEGSSIALLEAMLMGLPVIATRVSGAQDLVEPGRNGFLVEPGDEAALARKMRALLEDAPLRESFGREVKKKALAMLHQRPEKQWIDVLIETKKRDGPAAMKRANIAHYDSSQLEIEKSKTDASKIVYYPKLVQWLRGYIKKDQKVVDIGGGAGVVMAIVKQELGGLSVVGLDISTLMVKLRRSLSLNTNLVGDMDKLPIRADSADAVVFIASLHHTLNTDKAIRESCRILKPRGMLLLIEHNSFRFLFYRDRTKAIPAPDDPRECLINHRMVTRQLIESGFILKHISLKRQLVTLVQTFIKDIPLPVYRLLTAVDEKTGWIPGYKEFGSLMMIAAQKR